MRDYGAAIGLVLAIEGLLMAGFADCDSDAHGDRRRQRSGEAARVGPGAAVLGVAIVWASRLLL